MLRQARINRFINRFRRHSERFSAGHAFAMLMFDFETKLATAKACDVRTKQGVLQRGSVLWKLP